ncbi:MAG TPA: fatty acid--CoA ligase family protein [Stellaceae bacterium]|jgi:acyl-CoA synthetase (AMP-forming)/AMP-acid ligase II|nr:fatty acid--CoA ligase family protein [Stellaceae bacterium]
MPQNDHPSLWEAISAGGDASRELPQRWLNDVAGRVILGGLAGGSSLGQPQRRFAGRSVLIATSDQLRAALALIELDGVARRMVLYPPGVPTEYLAPLARIAEIDAIVSDRPPAEFGDIGADIFATANAAVAPAAPEQNRDRKTEWILLTSGTTGIPKLVVHSLASLAGATKHGGAIGNRAVWSTFYDIRRYGGLQIFLRAMLGGGSIVLSNAAESTADFLSRAGAAGVTHISGTPSHWRRALMSPQAHRIAPQYARLSGEIADQPILDHLQAFFPQASVAHAFASTEAGVAFDVTDGRAGFPADYIGRPGLPVELKIEDGSLRIRSNRVATRYLGAGSAPLAEADGFVDTGDMLEQRGDRYFFVGRRGGIINVGGQKVHPEEVEAVINHHPGVQSSLVRARKNPITGAIVVADIVPKPEFSAGPEILKREILDICREALPAHKVPAVIRVVASLDVTAAGKLHRARA